jgi:septal ring factor EnvC (AmiA/AmiB activator)
LLKAEDSLNAIDPPAITAEIKRMESVYTLIKDDVTNQISQLKENNEKDIARLRDEIGLIDDRNSEINTMVKKSEADLSASERELRDDVYGMEKEMQKSFKDMDVNIKQVRTDLELRIKEILTNPLNNGSK